MANKHKLKKYIVSMAVEGRIDVEVEATSVAEAFQKADDMMPNDLSDMEVVDTKPVNCSDEEGNILEDYNG